MQFFSSWILPSYLKQFLVWNELDILMLTQLEIYLWTYFINNIHSLNCLSHFWLTLVFTAQYCIIKIFVWWFYSTWWFVYFKADFWSYSSHNSHQFQSKKLHSHSKNPNPQNPSKSLTFGHPYSPTSSLELAYHSYSPSYHPLLHPYMYTSA